MLLLAPAHAAASSWAKSGARRAPSATSPISPANWRTAVREGRRAEFRKWPQFADPANREKIPDPNAPQTAAASATRLGRSRNAPRSARRLALVRKLLDIRAREICAAPRRHQGRRGDATRCSGRARSPSRGGSGRARRLRLMANFGDACAVTGSNWGELRPIYELRAGLPAEIVAGRLPGSAVLFALRERPR